ncbi:MAG: ATP-binding cassette domain-containing protein [Alicyclobacillus herbarius]|nr:ATP-binding cassette domain-containing protein [Alicyclobacillus herbarius]
MQPGERAVQVSHVEQRFGKNLILRDTCLEVHSSEIFGLLGPSGAGKTTLIKLIAGLDNATSGQVSIHMPRPWKKPFSRMGVHANEGFRSRDPDLSPIPA